MSFRGYLIKFGSTANAPFPQKYLAQDPVITPCGRMEAEAYRDANGDLHRVTLDNFKTKIELTTLPITLEEKLEIEAAMRRGLINSVERKYLIEYFNDDPESDSSGSYRYGYFYLSDVSYTYRTISSKSIKYEPIKYTFIEY